MNQTRTRAERIPAQLLFDAMRQAGITDVVAVPDTHVRTLITLLQQQDEMPFIQTATEDEAVCVAAGLIIGGRTPLVQIQHAGLYACVNHLRGVAMDGAFPMLFMIGLLGRDPDKPPRENFDSMVRYAEPLLETFGVPSYLLEGPEDVGMLETALREAIARQGPTAVLIGDATS